MVWSHRNRWLIRQISAAAVLVSTTMVSSCGDEEKKNDEPSYTDVFRGGQGNGQENNDMSQVSGNLGHVVDGMVPGSLVIGDSLALVDGQNPCEGLSFADCQTPLLRLYLATSQMMLQQTRMIIAEVSQGLAALPAGSSGSILGEDDEDGVAKIAFDIIARDEFRVIFWPDPDGEPFAYVSVSGDDYKIQFNGAHSPDEGAEPTRLSSEVTYNSATDFSIRFVANNMPCDDNDVGAPNAIGVDLVRSGDVWQGKAHMYSPRWTGVANLTCDDEPTDDSKIFLYTDFVGDSVNTTASLYMLKEEVDDAALFSSWQMSDYCDHFPGCDENGYAWGMSQPLADAFENPYCVGAEDAAPDWGGACSSEQDEIATPVYSDASRWILPEAFANFEISLPLDLD